MRTIGRLILAMAMGCSDAPTEKADEVSSDAGMGGVDSGDVDAWTPCDEGLEVGDCPGDVPLVDGAEAPHAFSDYRGGPVLIMGVAEW